ncbi:hypothetical protein DFJ58DRAFT_884468 [Suillus subalutaceus]|uniref:uncharacterized protein n=1 Tax=Suillus subalutaceus TaxID=48586 RepID=UPI001B86DAA4|nr:uncharacterized protein DFJ58DRAFT_884468 [Suillus subalutaceus]KAG1852772.1 hypothetical protein DFJ58DRAFT_884468 [Suillus subalutaceus]
MSSLQQNDLAFLSSLVLRHSAVGLVTDCESCGGAVPITICRSDKNGNEGKPMAMHRSCSFYRWYPQLMTRPDIMALIPLAKGSPTLTSSLPTVSTSLGDVFSTAFSSTQPSTSTSHPQWNGKKPRKWGGQCAGPFCRKVSALWCPQGMCLSHCTENGGCPIHGVETHNQRMDVQPLDVNGFYLEDAEAETSYGHRELQQALEASMAATGGQPAPFPSFHDLLTVPNPSQLPPPSPARTPPPSSHPLRPSDDAALSTWMFPVHKLSKAARVTDQLDPLWAGDLNARAQEEIMNKRITEC